MKPKGAGRTTREMGSPVRCRHWAQGRSRSSAAEVEGQLSPAAGVCLRDLDPAKSDGLSRKMSPGFGRRISAIGSTPE